MKLNTKRLHPISGAAFVLNRTRSYQIIPTKNQIVATLIVTAAFMVAYNKVPAIRRVLGGA